MPSLLVHPPALLMIAATLAGAVVMLAWRAREGRRPVTLRSVIIPPLGMSTGLCMFVVPATRVPPTWALAALTLGALVFAIPLIRTSRLVREGERILVQRSGAFIAILLGLVAVRFGLRTWLEQYVSPLQTGAPAFLLAFGAVVRWRLEMPRGLRRLPPELGAPSASGHARPAL